MKTKKNQNGEVEILIAEDSPTQQAQLEYLLREHGYAVVAAANGKEALAAARQRRPTLIISDVMMPELDGYGLCKAIKSDETLRDIPVILVTTLTEPQDVIRGLECGADNFIRKPYEARYLLSRIEYLLMHIELRKNQKMHMGVEIYLGGEKHFITAERQQILDLLISTYEQAVHINEELKAREKDLAHSNQVIAKHKNIFELSPDPTWIIDGNQFIECNDAAISILGYTSREELLKVHPSKLSPPMQPDGEDSYVKAERMMTLARERGLHRFEWVHTKVDGKNFVAEVTLSTIEINHRHVIYCVWRDITERKQAEMDILRFKNVLDNTLDMIFMFEPESLRFVYVNQGAILSMGYSQEELLGMMPYQIKPLIPEPEFRQLIAPLLSGKQPSLRFDTVHRRKDGSDFSVGIFLQLVTQSDGSRLFVAIVQDITERKHAESRIMSLNRVYAMLTGINPAIVRVQGRQELFNEACRVAVEHGQFVMAWIGVLDPKTLEVTPAAVAAMTGMDVPELFTIRLNVRGDLPQGQGETGRAIREKTLVFSNDISVEPGIGGALRKAAIQRGFRSVIALPLQFGGEVVGNFTLFAKESNFFDTAEIKLLTELAGEISFALDHIEKEERLKYLAYYDVLTGLPNRALFSDRLNQLLHAAKKQDKAGRGRKVAVLLLDLERFHAINETIGRAAADTLLKQVAERLSGGRLGPDHLARINADTFAALLGDIERDEEAVHFVEQRVIAQLHQPFLVGGQELRLSAKAGIALFPVDGEDADALLRNAEAALIKAKFFGDKYLFYTPELNALVAGKLTLENKLRRALEQKQLVLHYQPKINLKNGQISGLEVFRIQILEQLGQRLLFFGSTVSLAGASKGAFRRAHGGPDLGAFLFPCREHGAGLAQVLNALARRQARRKQFFRLPHHRVELHGGYPDRFGCQTWHHRRDWCAGHRGGGVRWHWGRQRHGFRR